MANSVAHTKGSWIEIIPAGSLTFDACGFLVGCDYLGYASTNLLDIGFGSSPTVVLSNLMVEQLAMRVGLEVFIPLSIPSGTRVAVRNQSTAGSSGNPYVTLTPLGQGFLPSTWPGAVETLGVTSSGATKGTLVDPGSLTNRKGTWTELTTVSGLSRPSSMLLLMVGTRADGTLSIANWYLDIGIGDGTVSGTQTVYPDIFMMTNSATDQLQQHVFGPYPFTAPAATRLWARAQCSMATASKRTFNLAAYAFG
jgi:hypothetical protein